MIDNAKKFSALRLTFLVMDLKVRSHPHDGLVVVLSDEEWISIEGTVGVDRENHNHEMMWVHHYEGDDETELCFTDDVLEVITAITTVIKKFREKGATS